MYRILVVVFAVLAVLLASTLAYSQKNQRNYQPRHASSWYRRAEKDATLAEALWYQKQINAKVDNEQPVPYRTSEQRSQQERSIKPAHKMNQGGRNVPYIVENEVPESHLEIDIRKGEETDNTEIFPRFSFQKSTFVPIIPKECEKLGVCEQVPNYPYEHIEQLIDQTIDFTHYKLDVWSPQISYHLSKDDSESLCDFEEKATYPEAARRKDGKWVFILNKKNEKYQGFMYQECKSPEKQCHKAKVDGARLECNQRYTQRPLWSVSETGGVVLEHIPTASCCSCMIKQNSSLSAPFY